MRPRIACLPIFLFCLLPALAAEEEGLKNADHWSFQPLREVVPPESVERHPIDAFIRKRLAEEKLAPNPQATRRILIRRLTFDLHGLPPTPEEIDAFVSDPAGDDEAVRKLIARLLDSPRYGERWARHWLDVVRYSESQGFERDKFRPHSWRYRDYVIDSLNADKPYDQFAREQIAGDVLEPVTSAGIAATGFLVAGPWDEVGSSQQSQVMKRRVREEELEDLISAVGQTFLGVTINCSRCHDHKFDPIPAKDYFAFKAVFEGVRHGERTILTPSQIAEREKTATQRQVALASAEAGLASLRQNAVKRFVDGGKRPTGEIPFARWTFERGDAVDEIGGLAGELKGGAVIRDGRLILNGKDAFLQSAPLAKTLEAKTLEAWVKLPELNQRAGGVISIERTDVHGFDALVFGERQPKKWIAGSNFFKRTHDLEAPLENAKPEAWIHVAAAYEEDGTIAFYRNGRPYGAPYKPEEPRLTYPQGDSHVLIGLRLTGAKNGFLKAEIDEARIYDRALSAKALAASFSAGPQIVGLEDLLSELTEAEQAEFEILTDEKVRLAKEIAASKERPLAYAARIVEPPPTHFLERGDPKLKGEVMAPGGLSALKADFGLAADAPEAERRKAFANWLASPENPLFARAIVNRVWHFHFGAGLVNTPNDLGVSGSDPSHPDLLDWLAAEFVRSGSSLKKLHTLILTSQTWQQSSDANQSSAKVDVDNRLLWRFAPKRLEAEAMRDSMLAISGELNPKMGGPSDQPFELLIDNTHFYTFQDRGEPEFNRRTIYRAQVASLRDNLMDSLDCPSIGLKTPVRGITSTPVQALSLMNNSFVDRQSRKLAERLEKAHPGDFDKQLALGFWLVLGRGPSEDEREQVAQILAEHSMVEICWALFNTTEFAFLK